MESTGSSSNSQQPQLPPGFRFHPTDEELVVHYLKRKASSIPLPVTIIADVDLYKFDPWELPGKATFGDQEWYFFSPRDRKYPNGARPNRAATSGYWKATGTDKPILTSVGNHKVGVKKALVFYGGRPPRGVKTNWIMHEYRLTDTGGSTKPALPATDIPKKSSLRLDDWVLCRIYKKNSQRFAARDKGEGDDKILAPLPQSQDLDPPMSNISLLENDVNFFDGLLARVMDDNNIQCNGDSANDQLRASSSTSKPSLNVALVPFKRPNASSSACWLDDLDQPPAKRLSSNSDSCSGGVMRRTSLTAMLNQLPQGIGASYPNQNLITSLGQGIFRQNCQLSSMNWDS